MKILITGGAGFVGASLAKQFKQFCQGCEVIAFDSLRRRGSELNIPLFKTMGIQFVHGDVRVVSDFQQLRGDFDLIIDAAAEPSVHAGSAGSPDDVVQTNVTGTFNCLNFARNHGGAFLFLSTSRVYSIAPLRSIELVETANRFEIAPPQQGPGISVEGISEDFPTNSARSFYGATKFAAEMLLQEFVATYGMKGVIYRCGVLAGPGQFGKADQGVFTLWLVHHYFRNRLEYTGFGGQGKQVRDLMHPSDLSDLIWRHLPLMGEPGRNVFNVGGGRSRSVSLAELTEICRDLTGNRVAIASKPETAEVDIPLFVTDSRRIREAVEWMPKLDLDAIFRDTLHWIQANESQLRSLFC